MEYPDTQQRSHDEGRADGRSRHVGAALVAGAVLVTLPLVGLASLLYRSRLDPHFENYRLHFLVFGVAGALAFVLGYAAGEAANRRRDARVLLISLAFMATGGFLGLHAVGTPEILFQAERPGFQVAIPIGLMVSAVFAAGSAFVDIRPGIARAVIRHRSLLRIAVFASIGAWFVLTVVSMPPLRGENEEAASGGVLAFIAIVGTALYALGAARYWHLFRHRWTVLPAAVIACFLLLSEALIGVAVTGERKWHASWWEWHGLIITAYVVIGVAVRREWRDERFRRLYLPTTRERRQEISVLFGDLVGFTAFAERASAGEVATVLNAYWSAAAPLITRRYGGELEKFIGDGVLAVFNSRGDQPDHAERASRAALALQRELARLAERNPEWPPMRVGINSGEAVLREVGGPGHVAYPLVGDTVNTGARLERLAPAGGVLIGESTYRQLPTGALVAPRVGLRVKGKADPLDAYLLLALPRSA
ncbi:MAG TPA: adenylate/guanylate cyclase domain-containing protein [Gaiella sp.]